MTQSRTLDAATAIPAFLHSVEIGQPQCVSALTIWPLRARAGHKSGDGPSYMPLSEAMARNLAHVEEVSAQGSVPNIRVQNRADVAVLVLFGEEIIGAKQNRIANASFLVAAGADSVIDVSCVESGRWSHTGPTRRRRGDRGRGGWIGGSAAPAFQASESLVSNTIRRKMQRHVSDARAAGLGYRSDQGQVWDEVEKKIRGSGTRSDSRAYADYRRERAVQLGAVRGALQPRLSQVGFVASIEDEIVGVEAVGQPEIFRGYFDRLIDAYAVDAIDADLAREHRLGRDAMPTPEERREESRSAEARERAQAFLDALGRAHVDAAPSLGLGQDLRLASDAAEGSALFAGEIVHLTAAPLLREDGAGRESEDGDDPWATQADQPTPIHRRWRWGGGNRS